MQKAFERTKPKVYGLGSYSLLLVFGRLYILQRWCKAMWDLDIY